MTEIVPVKPPDLSVVWSYDYDEDGQEVKVSNNGLDIRFKDRHRFALLAFGDVDKFMYLVYGKPQDIIKYINERKLARGVYSQQFIRVIGFKYVCQAISYIVSTKTAAPANLLFSDVNLFRVPEQTDCANFEFVASDGQSFFIH